MSPRRWYHRYISWMFSVVSEPCKPPSFSCLSGTGCHPVSFWQDGEPDCADHSDEGAWVSLLEIMIGFEPMVYISYQTCSYYREKTRSATACYEPMWRLTTSETIAISTNEICSMLHHHWQWNMEYSRCICLIIDLSRVAVKAYRKFKSISTTNENWKYGIIYLT